MKRKPKKIEAMFRIFKPRLIAHKFDTLFEYLTEAYRAENSWSLVSRDIQREFWYWEKELEKDRVKWYLHSLFAYKFLAEAEHTLNASDLQLSQFYNDAALLFFAQQNNETSSLDSADVQSFFYFLVKRDSSFGFLNFSNFSIVSRLFFLNSTSRITKFEKFETSGLEADTRAFYYLTDPKVDSTVLFNLQLVTANTFLKFKISNSELSTLNQAYDCYTQISVFNLKRVCVRSQFTKHINRAAGFSGIWGILASKSMHEVNFLSLVKKIVDSCAEHTNDVNLLMSAQYVRFFIFLLKEKNRNHLSRVKLFRLGSFMQQSSLYKNAAGCGAYQQWLLFFSPLVRLSLRKKVNELKKIVEQTDLHGVIRVYKTNMSGWIWNLGRNYIDFFSKFWPEVRKGLKDRDRKFYYGELRFKEDKSFSFVVDEYLTDLEVYNRLLSNTNVMSMRFAVSSLVDEGYNLLLPKIRRKLSVRQYRVAWIARVVYYYQLKKIFKKLILSTLFRSSKAFFNTKHSVFKNFGYYLSATVPICATIFHLIGKTTLSQFLLLFQLKNSRKYQPILWSQFNSLISPNFWPIKPKVKNANNLFLKKTIFLCKTARSNGRHVGLLRYTSILLASLARYHYQTVVRPNFSKFEARWYKRSKRRPSAVVFTYNSRLDESFSSTDKLLNVFSTVQRFFLDKTFFTVEQRQIFFKLFYARRFLTNSELYNHILGGVLKKIFNKSLSFVFSFPLVRGQGLMLVQNSTFQHLLNVESTLQNSTALAFESTTFKSRREARFLPTIGLLDFVRGGLSDQHANFFFFYSLESKQQLLYNFSKFNIFKDFLIKKAALFKTGPFIEYAFFDDLTTKMFASWSRLKLSFGNDLEEDYLVDNRSLWFSSAEFSKNHMFNSFGFSKTSLNGFAYKSNFLSTNNAICTNFFMSTFWVNDTYGRSFATRLHVLKKKVHKPRFLNSIINFRALFYRL